jgi:hypothetical protein
MASPQLQMAKDAYKAVMDSGAKTPQELRVVSSALRVAARCPGAVRSVGQKTLPHRGFAKTVAPRSRVTRHLPLPVHLKLQQRLPRFALRRSSKILR